MGVAEKHQCWCRMATWLSRSRPVFKNLESGNSFALSSSRNEDENETSDIDAGPGRQLNVRGDAIFLRDRRRSRLRIRLWPCLLLRAASARVLSGLCLRSCSGNRLLVDRRILVSLWRPLFLAARILGAPALSWRVLAWPALLRRPLLPRLLGTPVTNFIRVCAAS